MISADKGDGFASHMLMQQRLTEWTLWVLVTAHHLQIRHEIDVALAREWYQRSNGSTQGSVNQDVPTSNDHWCFCDTISVSASLFRIPTEGTHEVTIPPTL